MSQRDFIEVMAKHLPPSAAQLKLLDVGQVVSNILLERRADLQITPVSLLVDEWQQSSDSVDSVVAYDSWFDKSALDRILQIMRPGGRLIVVLPMGMPDESYVHQLESSGYTRILVETATTEGVLIRGEKPHTTQDTQKRMLQIAQSDADKLDWTTYKGRYIHLLIQQQPNKPVWKLTADDVITWDAAAIQTTNMDLPILLAFSSLPKAVSLMQPAVVQGVIRDVNKVGKFSRHVAQLWQNPVWLNPTLGQMSGKVIQFVSIDPATAEAPDE